MSEEDKILKKIKIEQNRTKRKPIVTAADLKIPTKIKREVAWLMEEDSPNRKQQNSDQDDTSDSQQSLHYKSTPTQPNVKVVDSETENMFPVISSSTEITEQRLATSKILMPTLESTSTEIVDRLVNFPEDASKLINHLMKTPTDAVAVMTKILNSQKDAMRLIGHLIGSPGDALKIISKIMNSPFDALTVFTKFMSSPTDALEIIAKIASSPSEVLQFIQQLMNAPEDALQIMNKFMNSPAEALKMLNKMVNNPSIDSTTHPRDDHCTADIVATAINGEEINAHDEKSIQDSHPMIKSILDNNNSDSVKKDDKFGSPETLQLTSITCDKNTKVVSNEVNNTNHNNNNINNTSKNDGSKTDESGNGNCSSETIRSLLQDINDEPVLPNSLESVICEAINLEYDAYSSMAQANSNNRDLNEAERAKLNELIVANKALYAPLDEDLSGLDECSIKVKEIQYLQIFCLILSISYVDKPKFPRSTTAKNHQLNRDCNTPPH